MRRRRRNRSTWFPLLPFNEADGFVNAQDTTYDVRFLAPVAAGDPNVIAVPIIPDTSYEPSDATATDATLRDYVEGQTCIIQRCVGKVVWSVQQFPPGAEERTPNTVIACTALAVLGVDNDSGNQGSPELPSTEWDPLAAANAHKPYLWRRTWVLSNNLAIPDTSAGQYNDPASNEFFPGLGDGPHLDTKGTRRAIRRDERLFAIHSCRAISATDGTFIPAFARVIFDVRVLGMMVKARNKGQFT